MYLDALKDFPSQETRIATEKGAAFCQKVDIFKSMLWFSYRDEPANWHALTKDQVNEILEKNKNNEKIASLEEYAADNEVVSLEKEKVFENVVGQDSLTRFDKPKQKRNRNKSQNQNNKRRNNKKRPANNA
jgi:hypothetical protein